jgi:putative Holliday junction resolvase
MRTLAIDLGTRRIGLAMSDQGGQFATPLEVLEITSQDQALAPIQEICERESVERLVVGLPLNMDETIGPAAREAINWGRQLAAQLNLPVIFIDERLSSFEADQRLNDRKRSGEKMTRADRKRRLDAHAAAAILQSFLDGRLPPIAV